MGRNGSQADRRPTVAPNGRPTIGLITPGIDAWYDHAVWLGVDDAARELGANLIAFLGQPLQSPLPFSQQANQVYELAGEMSVDGLVLSSTLAGLIDRETFARYTVRYHPLPIVTINAPLEKRPLVEPDNQQGVRDMVHHLIDFHGYRRIAFIGGSPNAHGAQERHAAYVDALAAHGISVDSRLIAPGDYTAISGEAAVRLLVEQRGLRPGVDFDAVLAANDVMAVAALDELRARGVGVPHDVAVVGFDDADEAFASVSPLTTVRQPAQTIGRRAVETLLAMLEGRDVPDRATVPTELVVRRSCGCLGMAAMRAAIELPESAVHSLEQDLPAQYDQILAEMTAAATSHAYSDALKRTYTEHVSQLLSAFCAELLSDPSPPGLFMREVNGVLEDVVAAHGDPAVWHSVIASLRRRFLPYLDQKSWPKAEKLWQQAQGVIGRASRQTYMRQRLRVEKMHVSLHQAGAALGSAGTMQELADALAESLAELAIPSCYLSLYEGPPRPDSVSRLVLAVVDGKRLCPGPAEAVFPTCHLAPSRLLPRDRRYTMIVESLYHREEPLGLAVFEVGPRERMRYYEALGSRISSAVRMALLYQKATQDRLAAEQADRLKTRLLANVSHELRTPLNVIQGYVQKLGERLAADSELHSAVSDDIEYIEDSAHHLYRLIDDLLDLSRAEIGELDLHVELIEPRVLLERAFVEMAQGPAGEHVDWQLQLPARLPMIEVDPVRVRQIVLNLLSNAQKFTEQGYVLLGAEVDPPHLHVWVQDTGPGIPLDQQERIFEPFVTAEGGAPRRDGIGLGLSITRRLVALHQGLMTLDSEPDRGSTFHVYLPLPSLSGQPATLPAQAQPALLLLSSREPPAPEIVDLGRRQGLQIHRLETADEIQALAERVQPMALAHDLADERSDWMLIERLRQHPDLSLVPLILYGDGPEASAAAAGRAGVVLKPVDGETLLEVVGELHASDAAGSILIVDDDTAARELYAGFVEKGLPGYRISTAEGGAAAIETMAADPPSLTILDLGMPDVDGFAVLEWMRENETTRQTPVLILTGRALTFEDVDRLEQHASVVVQSKDTWSEAETIDSLHRVLEGAGALPPHVGAVAKRALAYMHQYYGRSLSVADIADAVQVSERHLQRIFRQELGLSPWQYLRRYRISRSRALLRHTDRTIKTIASQVGFSNQTHFGRVFRKLNGMTPSAYREQVAQASEGR